jgi:hypothetical protein
MGFEWQGSCRGCLLDDERRLEMPVGALIGGAVAGIGSLVSGVVGSNAAKDAANVQAQSAANALAFQKQVYDQNQSNLNPFITAGQGATSTLSRLTGGGATPADYSSFFNSPDYQFALQQGNRGVTNYENAQGMGLSGGALKDVAQFNQGLATQQYGNYFSRLMGLATLGGNAAGSLAGNNASMSSSIGNTIQGQGQAQASGIVGSANAITGGINSGISNSLIAASLGKNPSAYGGNNLGNMFFGGGSPSGYGTS